MLFCNVFFIYLCCAEVLVADGYFFSNPPLLNYYNYLYVKGIPSMVDYSNCKLSGPIS